MWGFGQLPYWGLQSPSDKEDVMINQVMFFVGLTIFIVYVYFLLRIIGRQHRIQRKEHADAYDQLDIDGMGNQGRIPDKKPKNRA